MKSKIIFDNADHQWIFLGRDDEKSEHVIDTNEYIILDKGKAMLLDPGGIEIFPQVLSGLTRYVKTTDVKVLFASHQDPDIISSLALWLDLCPDAKAYCSWIWTGFISHFSMGHGKKLEPIPDKGMMIQIGEHGSEVLTVPAHYCHSSGNFSIFDPIAKILFSGDIGGALLPPTADDLFVKNFNNHVNYMELFHRRWMPSTIALRAWVQRVRALNPKMICPQHGAIFNEDTVPLLLDWLESLEVGIWS